MARHEELEHVIGVLADAAKRDNMAYLVLAQLNRGLESRDDKRPRLADLKESGALEERAKAVLMLYRPAVYDDRESETAIELLLRKNNHGQTGTVIARWTGETTRIS